MDGGEDTAIVAAVEVLDALVVYDAPVEAELAAAEVVADYPLHALGAETTVGEVLCRYWHLVLS
jgi:hypothetical protein